MELLERVRHRRRLAARVWLVTAPSAILSFERRQELPGLPIGRLRFLGPLLLVIGVVVALRGIPASGDGPATFQGARSFGLARFLERPPVLGGLLALVGVGLVLRSLLLPAYAIGLGLAFVRQSIELEEPHLPGRDQAPEREDEDEETGV